MTYLIILLIGLIAMAFGDHGKNTHNTRTALENASVTNHIETDILPRADEKSFRPPAQSIFFHESSSKVDFNSRRACAVESAARAHPNWQINVLFSAPVTQYELDTGTFYNLRNYTNVKFFRVDTAKYVTGTPVETLVSGGALNTSEWPNVHAADVLRCLSLYRHGGIYLDLDVVVAKPLDSLARNWVGREDDTHLGSAVLAFSRDKIGREVAEAVIRDLGTSYRGDVWEYNGPNLMERVLGRRCDGRVRDMSAATCNGFEVYGPEYFYPIPWKMVRVYFDTGKIEERTSYVFHMWNKVSREIKINKDSPYSRLAKNYCPDIYNLYRNDFGG